MSKRRKLPARPAVTARLRPQWLADRDRADAKQHHCHDAQLEAALRKLAQAMIEVGAALLLRDRGRP